MTPEELKYTEEHLWVLLKSGDGGADLVRVGITEHSQQRLGDVLSVSLPEIGQAVDPGVPIGEVEAEAGTEEIYAPLAGEIVSVNPALDHQPDLINSDPYGEGWLFEIESDDPDAVEGLLDAESYQALVGE